MLEQGYCIRLSTAADGEAICALMRRAFDYGDGSNAALTTAWWQWKYSANPAGRYSIVCEGPDGRLLGHYGGTPSRVWSDGRAMTFGQNCDSCTDPDVRRGLRNPGLFVRLAQAYASTFSGSGDNALMYGLPIRSAHRIGARYLDYWLLRSQLGLVLDDLTALPAVDAGLVIEPVTTLPPDLDPFLIALRPSYRCHAERSAAFLRWRFLTHPNVRYQLAVVRRVGSGELRGYVVYRPSDFLGRGLGLLMDVMVLPGDDAALVALLRWVCDRAVADGRRGLFGLGAPPQPWFERLQQWGFRVETTPYVLAARPYAVIDPAYLREHWFYTLADYDIL